MSEDMSDIVKNLSSMLDGKKIPDNIKEMLNNLKPNDKSNNETKDDVSSSDSQSTNTGFSPEMLSSLASMFSNSGTSNDSGNDTSENSGPAIDMETILKMKTVMEQMNTTKDDPRSNLLLSLKPYLKDSRKSKVEQYIKFFNMSKVIGIINPLGGDKSK